MASHKRAKARTASLVISCVACPCYQLGRIRRHDLIGRNTSLGVVVPTSKEVCLDTIWRMKSFSESNITETYTEKSHSTNSV